MKAIKKIEQEREQRRLKMEDAKKEKQEKKALNIASGKNVDIDFQLMIEKSKFKEKMISVHQSNGEAKLAVTVRKRPIFKKQETSGQIDGISAANPQIRVHQPKFKVDGITKYVENHTFTFDNTFNEEQTTEDIYKATLKPLLSSLLKGGIVTCFAYGQTGSGKTFTMNGLQKLTVEELYELAKKNCTITVSFFQIYGGRCLDLLNDKTVLNILEDKSGIIQIPGLIEKNAASAKELLAIMQQANNSRTTHATVANDTSSRSHSICQVFVRRGNEDSGTKLVLVDLAGSQRAQDTQSNNRQRRLEGAEINKSLLALKQCIRAMDDKADHVPFRASKLTLILRDSFVNKSNTGKVVMIACVSPGSSSSDHSLNTLRYADRLKDQTELSKKCDEIIQQNRGLEAKREQSKEVMQKVDSANNLKKEEPKQSNGNGGKGGNDLKSNEVKNGPKNLPKAYNSVNQSGQVSEKPSSTQQSKPPNLPQINQQSGKKQQISKENKQKNRSSSYKKAVVGSNSNNNSKNSSSSNPALNKQQKGAKQKTYEENVIDQQIEIEQKEKARQEQKRKVKEDMNVMKRTMRNQKNEEFFAFQQKVSNILEEQQEVFATHMAAIKEDAKLLTQESELISKIQGVGFMDYDVDAYVDKLQSIIKKKMKMYTLLNKKVENFKRYLKEEDEIRHQVKETFYY